MKPLPSLLAFIRSTFATLRQRFATILALSSLALIVSMLIGRTAVLVPERWSAWTNSAFAVLLVVQIIWQGAIIIEVQTRERINVFTAIRTTLRHLWQLCVATLVTWAVAGLPLGVVLVADLLFGSNVNRWTVVDSALAAALFIALFWLIAVASALLFAPFRVLLDHERGLTAVIHSWRCVRGMWAGLALRLVSFFLLLMAVVFLLDFIPQLGPLLIGLAVTPLLTIFSFHLYTASCDHRNPTS